MIFGQRVLSTREQARNIRREVIELVDKANEFSVGSRRVNRRAAYKVISRSLSQSRGLPFSIRKHKAITDLSNYIALAKHNKVVGLMADHTDLLPISHPRSTKVHALSASALVQAKIQWFIDDPRIKDDTVKSLVASAMAAPTDSAEYKYALTRLENLPASELPLEVLTAAANPFAGKNSAAARRAREAIQLSDRFERWINMGRSLGDRATDGFRSYVRRNDGTTRSHSGTVLNQNMFEPQLVDIEVGKGKVFSVPVKTGEGLKAILKDPDSIDGYSQVEANPGNAPVISESDLTELEAPSIYRKEDDYRGKGKKFTDDKYDIIKFDNPKDALVMLDESNKRAAELDKPAPKQIKAGEVDPDTGRQFWNPDEPVFAVSRRGKKTAFAFAQSWKDVNEEIMADEPDLDEEEGRDYTRPEPKKEGDADDTVPLIEQANKIFDGKKRKKEDKAETAPVFPYTVPDRAYEFNPNEEYTPEFEFDDPQSLSQIDTPKLEEALLRSVEPVSATDRATGFAPLDLPNGDTEDVSSEAIAAALREKGEDAEMSLAKAYDTIAGNTKNQDDLIASREGRRAEDAAKPADLEEKFDEVVKEEPEIPSKPEVVEPEEEIKSTPVEEEVLTRDDIDNIPAFKGLSDEEKQSIFDSKDYNKYIPKNEDIEVPEGMYKPKESSEKDRSEAIEIAAAPRSAISNKVLNEKLKEAMEGDGTANLEGADKNGEKVDVPVSAESLRDAIALRGKDANAAVKKIAKPKKAVKEETPEAEEKPEEPVKKQVTYKRAGKRTLLRAGKGAPFRDKEVADFLAENGFEWSDTIERDGKTIRVKAQTKLQDDEEFKAFARELRDRFGIDLQPRPATDESPAQEPIDFDAPSPEKPVEEIPTPTPTPEAEAPTVSPTVSPEETKKAEKPEEAPKPEPETAEEEITPESIEEEIDKPQTEEEKSLTDKIRKALALASDQVLRGLVPLEKLSDRTLYNLFGPFNILKLNELIKRLSENDKKSIYGSRKDMISKLMLFKWGEGLKLDQPLDIQKQMTDYENQLMRTKTEDLEMMLDLYYDEMNARMEAEQQATARKKLLAEARAARRKAAEDAIIAEYIRSGKPAEEATKPEAAEETPKETKKVKRLAPGEKTKDGDNLDYLPAGSVVIDATGTQYRKNEDGTWDQASGPIGGNPWRKNVTLDPANGYEIKEIPGYDKDAPGTGIVEKVKLNAPKEGDYVKQPDGTWKRIAKLERTARKQPSDKAGKEDATIEDYLYIYEDGTSDVVKTTNGRLDIDLNRKRVDIVRSADLVEAPAPVGEATPASALVKKLTAKTSQLQPGDILVDDHFTITKIEQEGTKAVRVEGKVQEIPSYRVTGYFPNSVEQSSKLWSDNYAPTVYRGATPPAKGDLPELNQPKPEDYGTEYAWPNQEKVIYKGRTLYAPKNEELAEKFKEDYKAYDEERMRRKELWSAPEVLPSNDEDKVPSSSIYKDRVPASEIRVGDISFRKNKDQSLREFFTVTEVVGSKDGVTTIKGHYAGHQTQTKEWASDTDIDVIRGEANPPASGDKEPLDRPEKGDDYKELEAARQAKIAEADKSYTPGAFAQLTEISSKPDLPPFYGSAADIFTANGGNGSAVMAALDKDGFIVFDFETIGKNVRNEENPDAPIQVAASKYVGGKKVDSINLFINPGQPLGSYYYETDAEGNKVLRADRLRDSEGNPITDEWLATQPSVKEQITKLIEFMGDKPLLVGHNNTFDINLLERWSEKLGLDFSMGGAVDTLGIARAVQATEKNSISFPEKPKDGEIVNVNGSDWKFSKRTGKWSGPSNSLKPLSERLGVASTTEGDFHDAAVDIDVTEQVLRQLMGKVQPKDISAEKATEIYDAGFANWKNSIAQRKEDIRKIEANNLLAQKTTLDDAIKNVTKVSEEPVVIEDGEEFVSVRKPYKSPFLGETVTADWIANPDNVEFIPNARIKDLKLGDFIVGKNGNYQEVIAFADDETDPANAVKVFRADIEDGVVLENRDSDREDGGTGFFLNGRLEGGIFRPIGNKDKSSAEINTDKPKSEPINEAPVIIEPVQPVKGEDLNEDQVKTVVSDAVDTITSGAKPEATIKEAVKGANIDETIKDQVLGADRPITSPHKTKEGVQLVVGDRVINIKTNKVGRVAALFDKYTEYNYDNYVKVKYDDGTKGPVPSTKLKIVDAASEGYTPKVIKASDIINTTGKKSTKTVDDVVKIVESIRSKPLPEGAKTPENLPDSVDVAKSWKEKEAERDKLAEELNYTAIPTDTFEAIKGNLPAKISTTSFMPSLNTGEPMTVTFGFDKPNGRELDSYASLMNISSPDDILVFKATPEYILRKEHLATIKPDGTITWAGENQKRVSSVDLKSALDDFARPVMGLQPMAVEIDDEDEEPINSVLGTNEDSFDYSRVSKISPTSEQRSVIKAIMTGKNVVVRALAGTGKTSTLKLAAKRLEKENPEKNLTYIVFNKSVQVESSREFPKNTDVRTADSVGYWNVPEGLRAKTRAAKYITNNPDIAKLLEVVPTPVKVKGTEQNLGSREIPKLLRDAIDKFTASEDDKVTAKHFAGMNLDEIPPQFVEWANKMWEDISSPKGQLYTSPSDLTKVWALSKPDFSKGIVGTDEKGKPVTRKVDVVLYDEAQDINPVMAKVMREQKGIQTVYVGDSNQAIYGFRGAIDELNNIVADYDLPITETFRFGKEIAGIANRFLTKLDSKYRVKGLPSKAGEILDVMNDPTVIITRTNGGGISAMLEMIDKGKVVGVDEKTYKKYMDLLKDIEWLMRAGKAGGVSPGARSNPDKDLAGFSTWSEVISAVQRGESVGSASYMVNLLSRPGTNTQTIRDILSQVEPITEKPAPTEPFVPLTVEDLKDKTVGKLGFTKINNRFDAPVEYTVDKNTISVKNGKDFSSLLKSEGFEAVKIEEKNKKGEPVSYFVWRKQSDDLSETLPILNKIKRRASGYGPEKPIEVEVITAHKAKGKQWKRVRIYGDFKGPEISEQTGQLEMPPAEEMRLSYVAVTRAEEALELGSLDWIKDVTSEADESPNLSPVEELLGMSVGADPDPVTEEELVKDAVETVNENDKKANAAAEAIIAAIEKGVVPWRKPWDGGGFLPTRVSTGTPYKGSNVMRLWAVALNKGYTDNRWLTYKQAQKLGGTVKKGEKATYVIHTQPKKKIVKGSDGSEKEFTYYTPIKYIPVFNVEQTENVKLPPLTTRPPVPISEAETAILEAYKDKPEIKFASQDSAFYSPSDDIIRLPLREQFKSTQDFLETLIHELAHSTGHVTRLGAQGKRRDLQDNYGNHRESRGEEELIAEITVALIAAELGIEIDWENIASYAESWLGALKNDKSMIFVAARQAQEAADYMLGKPKPGEEEDDEESPVGEGVGSEGKTGEQIAEEKPATEETPQPNVGTEGQTGEQISLAKNRDLSVDPGKVSYKDGREYDLWDDVTYNPGEESNEATEKIHTTLGKQLKAADPEKIVDRNEISNYVEEILNKYGYGNKFFLIAKPEVAESVLGPIPQDKKAIYLEAAVAKANNAPIPQNSPLKDKTFPTLLIRSEGASRIVLLHEIAHMMDGGWKTGQAEGHSQSWYNTFLGLLDGEGFSEQANLIRSTVEGGN